MSELDELTLQAVLDTVREGIITVDATGTIILVNQEVQRIWGYDRNELIGQQLDMLLAGDYRVAHVAGTHREAALSVLQSAGQRLELSGLRKDGTTFPLEVFIRQVPAGDQLLFTAAVRDLSTQRRTERHLALQNAVNQHLIEAGNLEDLALKLLQMISEGLDWDLGLVWCIDGNAHVLCCTAVWHRSLVATAAFEEISRQMHVRPGVGLPGHVWVSGEPIWIDDILADRRFARFEAAAQAGLHTAFALPIQGRHEFLGVVELFSREIRPPDESLIQTVAVLAHQVGQFAERKRSEEALRASQEHFRLLVESVQNYAIFMLDPDGQIVSWNTGAERIKGYRTDEIIGRHFSCFYPDEDIKRGLPEHHLQVAVAKGCFRDEGWRVRKDGSRFWANTTITALRDEDGALRGFPIVTRDVTGRKQAQDALRQYAERLAHLRELDQAILAAHSSETIAQAALRQLRQLLPYCRATVTLFNCQTHEATVLAVQPSGQFGVLPGERFALGAFEQLQELQQGNFHIIDDIAALANPTLTMQTLHAQGMRSYISAPLRSQGELIGTLSLAADSPGVFTSEHIGIVHEVADQLAVTIQHARLFEQVRAAHQQLQILSRRLLEAQENERRHIARELHDEVGQALTAMKINLQAVQRLSNASAVASLIEDTIGTAEGVLQQVRNLSLDLRPSLLDDLGLGSALRWYVDRLAQRSGLAIHFACGLDETRLPSTIETACFRAAQEALTNVVRHAQAQLVDVEVQYRDGEVHLCIRDDGVGFDVRATWERAARGTSMGLLGMHERVELAGGQLTINSTPGRGTAIHVRFPVAEPSRGFDEQSFVV